MPGKITRGVSKSIETENEDGVVAEELLQQRYENPCRFGVMLHQSTGIDSAAGDQHRSSGGAAVGYRKRSIRQSRANGDGQQRDRKRKKRSATSGPGSQPAGRRIEQRHLLLRGETGLIGSGTHLVFVATPRARRGGLSQNYQQFQRQSASTRIPGSPSH